MAGKLFAGPGLVDMHVHFREPGFAYKEDIVSGAAAAAAGGVTTCCAMPNTSPVADTASVVEYIARRGAEDACVRVLPVGAITAGLRGRELTDFAALKAAGAVAVSDDGMPVVDSGVMRRALELASECGLLVISHCEEEASMAARDAALAGEVGARLHIAHVSLAETVDIIRRAKDAGVAVTAETCPHYFSLTSDVVERCGANACMNPPLRSERDVKAIIEGLRDGTIDVIATDHAPHSEAEKALGAGKAPNGIVGLETSFAVALTYLHHTGLLSLDDIIRLMAVNPAKVLGIEQASRYGEPLIVDNGKASRYGEPLIIDDRLFHNASLGTVARNGGSGVMANDDESDGGGLKDYFVFDPDEKWVVEPSEFKSKSRNSPFAGMTLTGRVVKTVCNGAVVYAKSEQGSLSEPDGGVKCRF